jgi:threonine dehydratase
MDLVSLADIEQARQRLQGLVRHTPLLPFDLPELPGEHIFLKPESLQPI